MEYEDTVGTGGNRVGVVLSVGATAGATSDSMTVSTMTRYDRRMAFRPFVIKAYVSN